MLATYQALSIFGMGLLFVFLGWVLSNTHKHDRIISCICIFIILLMLTFILTQFLTGAPRCPELMPSGVEYEVLSQYADETGTFLTVKNKKEGFPILVQIEKPISPEIKIIRFNMARSYEVSEVSKK